MMIAFQDGHIGTCPICRSVAQSAFSTEFQDVAKCQSKLCGHLFSTSSNDLDGLQMLDGPEIEHRDQIYSNRNARLFRYLSKRKVLVDGLRIIDFGAGSGHMTRELRRRFPQCQLQCVEGEERMAQKLIKDGFEVVAIENLRKNVDLVFMIEVIEHLADPVKTLSDIRALINDRGALFFSTPCGELRSGSRDTNAYATKEHIHFFTESSLLLSLEKAGFGNVQLFTINAMYPRRKGIRCIVDLLKDLLRPFRNKILGYHHLVGFAFLR